jgi:hypothetical protein
MEKEKRSWEKAGYLTGAKVATASSTNLSQSFAVIPGFVKFALINSTTRSGAKSPLEQQ